MALLALALLLPGLLRIVFDPSLTSLADLPHLLQLGYGAYLVAALGFVVYTQVTWRCPACGADLGRSWNPRACPKCYVRLR